MHNQDPEVRLCPLLSSQAHAHATQTLEREKQKNLKGEQDDKSAPMDKAPGWNQHLASRSEAEVKVRVASPPHSRRAPSVPAHRSPFSRPRYLLRPC
jgi:hypothetical protein